MRERVRAAGLWLYAASVVATVALGVFAVSGRLEAFVLGEPLPALPAPCASGAVTVEPYFHDQPEALGCARDSGGLAVGHDGHRQRVDPRHDVEQRADVHRL